MSFVLHLLNSQWAIIPERLRELEAIYERRIAEGRLQDLAAIEAAAGKRVENQPQGYTVENGVAVVPLMGVLAKRANLFQWVSGASSHQLFARDMAAAAVDYRVEAILVEADTPGGTVDGTPLAAAAVRAMRGVKPIITLADSCMCSAGYWIGAFADEVFASDSVTQVGSIGVLARHIDTSRAEEARGVKVSDIVAGKYKGLAGPHAPLTDEGRAAIQASVDATYAEFLAAVSQARGRSVGRVHAEMADGRIFHARDAQKAGLIDGIATRQEAIARLRNRVANSSRPASKAVPAVASAPLAAIAVARR